MKLEEFADNLFVLISSILFTTLVVGVISFAWQQLEIIYLGAANPNPVDTFITMLYAPFVYLWAVGKAKEDLYKFYKQKDDRNDKM